MVIYIKLKVRLRREPINEGVLRNRCSRGVLVLENLGVLEEIKKRSSRQNEVVLSSKMNRHIKLKECESNQ